MICVSIGEISLKRCMEILEDIDLAEIRLDKTGFTIKEIQKIFSQPKNLIATYRPGEVTDTYRKKCLLTAIYSGSRYVDIELEASTTFKNDIIQKAKKHDCKIIISYHDFQKTPQVKELFTILNQCFQSGADIAKIACKVCFDSDVSRILSVYDYKTNKKIISIGIGEKGKLTRIVAPFLGAPFTYASLEDGKETAEGQMDRKKLKKILEIIQNA